MLDYRGSVARKATFEAHVAKWAIELQNYAINSYEFIAIPEMEFSREGDAEGLRWVISTGTHYKLHVKAQYAYDDQIPHITASLKSSVEVYRDINTDELKNSNSGLHETITIADMILDTFDGHVVASWWPNERETYARWLANGKPQWKNNPKPWNP